MPIDGYYPITDVLRIHFQGYSITVNLWILPKLVASCIAARLSSSCLCGGAVAYVVRLGGFGVSVETSILAPEHYWGLRAS